MRSRSVGMLFATWVLLVCGSLWANLVQLDASEIEIGNAAASSHFEKDILVRRWATGHGGVYVPPTPETPPRIIALAKCSILRALGTSSTRRTR